VTISDTLFEGHRIYFVNAIGEEMPFAPAWCVTDDAFVLAAFPQMVKSYLMRGADAPTLADVPGIAKVWTEDTAPVSVTYADMADIFRTAYPILHPVASLICAELQSEGLAIDISLLPSARSILPHLTPAIRSVSRTDDAIIITSRASLPIGGTGLGAAVPVLGMGFFGVRTAVARDTMVRHEMVDREMKMQAASELQRLGVALQLYEVENNRLPDSLEALVEAGHLPQVPMDPRGAPILYLGAGAEGEAGSASTQPVAALSHPLQDGRRPVLYRDGRVETVPEHVFQSQRDGM
jgi:hypothetical protein